MGSWQLDPYHTQVEFSAKHLGMMTVRGYFDEVSTTADIDPDAPGDGERSRRPSRPPASAPTTGSGTTTSARRTSSRWTSSR